MHTYTNRLYAINTASAINTIGKNYNYSKFTAPNTIKLNKYKVSQSPFTCTDRTPF